MTASQRCLACFALALVTAITPACAGRQARVRVLPPALPPGAYDPAGAGAAGAERPARTAGTWEIVRTAKTLIGAPYREGGALPDGFDCSGLVTYVFARNGVAVPRDVRRQAASGVSVPRSGVLPGDLVFFSTNGAGPTHVGIAVGGGEFIHAPKSGSVVRIESLDSSYWKARLVDVRRLAGLDLEARPIPRL